MSPSPLADLDLSYLSRAERAELARLLDGYDGFRLTYYDAPDAFVDDCVDGVDLYPYQRDILSSVPVYKRVCVRSLHGIGKTAQVALLVLWFALTRDGLKDWKIITTASAWRQLQKFLWPEIHKWAGKINWRRVGRQPFTQRELLDLSIKLSTGEAFAVASNDVARIEGAHASALLYIFDESKAIPAETFDGAEGAFTQDGVGGKEAFAVAVSTPGEPFGRFYDIQSRKPGYEDWRVRHVSLAEAVAAGQIAPDWADKRRRQWGEKSPIYRNRVLGEFAADGNDGVIPLSWVEAANERWLEWMERIAAGEVELRVAFIGADIADGGADQSTAALRVDAPDLSGISELIRYPFSQRSLETAGRLRALRRRTGGRVVVDGIGVGSGVVQRLAEMGDEPLSFIASAATDVRDSTGELGFKNLRSAAWWGFRERLDPDSSGVPIALPPDDMLTGDLVAPRWRVLSGGVIAIESKDDIRKRIGRSTDSGDAVIQAYGAHLIEDSAIGWEVF